MQIFLLDVRRRQFAFLWITVASLILPTHSLQSQAPTNGLIAYWPFSGNANDGSGNGHHGTLFGPTLVPDRFGTARSAYSFDGVNDYIQVPHTSTLNFDSNFTITAWVKFCTDQSQASTGGADGPGIVVKGQPFSGYGLVLEKRDKMTEISTGNLSPSTSLKDGQWHLLTIVWRFDPLYTPFPRQLVDFYIDGTLRLGPILETLRPYIRGAAAPLHIGLVQRSTWPVAYADGYFKGAIDDIRLYNRALSSQEIQSIYTENNWPVSPPPPPVASVSISSTGSLSYCASDPLPVQLRAIGEYDSVVWEPRAGLSSSTIANPVAMPEVTTTYRVRALKFGSNPPCTDTAENVDSIRIEVFESPEADAGPALYPCEGDVVELGGVTRGGSGGYRWEWSPAEGLDDVTLERPHLLVSQSGKYEVIVIDRQGCRDTSSVQITMLSRPRVVIEGSDTMYYCRDGGGLGLVAEGSGGNPPYQYQWSGEGLNRTDSSAVLAVPTKATVYVVEIRDGAGICSGYDSVLVIPTESPIAEAGEGQSLCVGESVKLGDGSGGNLEWEYEWQPRVGLSDGSVAEPEASPISTTVYRVRVRDPKSGCFSEDSVEVRVRDVRVRSTVSVVDYGLLGGCRTDSIRALVLENEGKSSGSITSWRSDVAGVSVLDVGGVLAGESETTVRVRFAPSGSGSYRGILVLYIGPCGDSVEVEVVGSKESSSIGIDVGSVDFGLRPSCVVEEVDTVLVITNSSGSSAEIGSAIVGAPYTVLSPSLPATIGAGETVEVRVRYAPVGVGSYVEELRLPYKSGACADTLRVSLRGEVEGVELVSDISILDFGLLDGCTTERDTVIEVENSSSFTMTIDGSRLPSGYVLLERLPLSIGSGSRRSLRLRYSPSSGGVSMGQGVLEYEPCSGELSIDLRGEKRGVRFTLADTIDFGELVSCAGSEKELMGSILMESEGTGDGSVRSVRVEGAFSSDLQSGSVLEDGKATEFVVRFEPTGEGFYEGALVVEIEPCGVERRVVLRGRSTLSSVRGESLSFGLVPSGSQRRGEVLFINDGSSSQGVERVFGVVSPFRVVRTIPGLPTTLVPGDTLHVELEYTAERGTSRSDVVMEVSSPCAGEYMAEVSGEGSSGGYSRIVLPELSGSPGEELELRVEVAESMGLDIEGGARFVAEVEFESSVLVGLGGSVGEIEGDQRIVEVRGDLQGGEAALRVTLGRVESTALRLRSIRWETNEGEELPVVVDTIDGKFTLNGLCRSGGVRLYDPRGSVGIKSVSPNPSGGKVRIEYSVVESGEHRMRIVDGMGREVGEIFEGLFVAGEYALEWGGSGLSSGVYWIVLETPTVVITQPLQVRN